MQIYLNLGSNLGSRMALIGRACAVLARRLAPARLLMSSYVESEPWGFDSPHPFLNRGILVLTERDIHPEAVLDITQAAEREVAAYAATEFGLSPTEAAAHRNADGTYRDRPIDIDIIDIGGLAYHSPSLTLPHPRAHQRPFVLTPWQELLSAKSKN